MKKIVSIIVLVVMATGGLFAQNFFFPSKKGTSLVYANLDAKGKVVSHLLQTIKDVKASGNNYTIHCVSQGLDKNRNPLSDPPTEMPLIVNVSNGVVEWDMKSFAVGTEGAIEIEGDKLQMPSTLKIGDKLKDVAFSMTINVGIQIRTEISLTDMECVGVEEVTVPAGTFKCHKVTQTINTTAMRRTLTTKTLTWYAPGIGTVKSETYDAKGSLTAKMELVAMEG